MKKMILTCISNFEQDFYKNIHDNIDYEHIFARKKYNIHKNKGIIPAGALGNIMLLDENLNRKLKEKYLYDIFDPIKISTPDTIEYNYIRKSFYPDKSKLEAIELDIISNEYSSLSEMIRKRGEQLIDRLTEILYKK